MAAKRSSATEVHQLAPGLTVWHRYDSIVKADLFSTAVVTAAGAFIVDPIAPDAGRRAPKERRFLKRRNSSASSNEPLSRFGVSENAAPWGHGPIAGIVVTNANHRRASEDFAQKFSAPIHARREAEICDACELREGAFLSDELQVIFLEGAAPGEVALFWQGHGGVLIMGDALINFGSHGFTFLPAKYCSDSKLMRQSLRKLLDLDFEKMLFAHGTPIMGKARERLAVLLAQG